MQCSTHSCKQKSSAVLYHNNGITQLIFLRVSYNLEIAQALNTDSASFTVCFSVKYPKGLQEQNEKQDRGNIFHHIDVNANSIVSNANAMKTTYPLNKNGYFSEKGKNCRVIKSKDPIATSKDFYNKIAKGGKELSLSNKHGVMTVLPDKTRIVYRIITSTKGSPAIEITVTSSTMVKKQKIHFISEV